MLSAPSTQALLAEKADIEEQLRGWRAFLQTAAYRELDIADQAARMRRFARLEQRAKAIDAGVSVTDAGAPTMRTWEPTTIQQT